MLIAPFINQRAVLPPVTVSSQAVIPHPRIMGLRASRQLAAPQVHIRHGRTDRWYSDAEVSTDGKAEPLPYATVMPGRHRVAKLKPRLRVPMQHRVWVPTQLVNHLYLAVLATDIAAQCGLHDLYEETVCS